ncbi:endoplasmic reticulum metallopeptidase 1 [Drosophila biarmipes]|uniref:endoplasmic reticulum metallopeptidase 1 n=1 Tax=Drosophila biarmipes TaxID=125945 RepID=UPI001CDB17D7|nr:endoplasmic reticulum metallopeptidase 1 [Drosophila biarmipes]
MIGSEKGVRRRVLTPPRDPLNTDALPKLHQHGDHPNGCERTFVQGSKIKSLWAPAFLGFWLLLYVAISIPACHRLPRPLTIQDEAKYPDQFIAERADNNLRELVSLGPRVVGSRQNEMAALKMLSQKMQKIRSASANDIEVDVQVASGSYVHWSMVNMYQSIQNIVVKISPKGSNSTTYLLVNSHYDSVPAGPGAGDDGSMVATMMEVLRVLAKSDKPLKNPVAFLFNGAEEDGLLGSHAFITQHKWAKYCKAFINLDSCGSGGREILFQSGPNHPWLMKNYRRAIKHPYASTMGEELFQHNFIPSDTDFRIFRDHGSVPGLDMAYTYNGFVYHTRHDKAEIFPRGSLQHTGDNLLALVRQIANSPEIEDSSKYAEGHTIYFDVMGWFLVFYTETEGVILNVIVALAAIGICGFAFKLMSVGSGIKLEKILKRVLHTLLVQILSVVVGAVLPILLGLFMDAVHLPLSWFTNSWLILGLYFTTFFFGLAIVPALYFHWTKHDKLPIGQRIQLLLHCHCVLLAVLTLVFTICGIRSVFVLMLSCLFYTMGLIINIATKLHSKDVAWVIPHIVCTVPPFVFFAYFSHGFFTTFIPMFGRFGENLNPDLAVAVFSVAVGFLCCGFIIPVLQLFNKSKTIICGLMGITLLCFIISMTPVGFPYRPETNVQRFAVLHTKRTFHDAENRVRRQESVYLIMPQDRRVYTVEDGVINMTTAQLVGADCKQEINCGLPLRWHKTSLWIPAPEPVLGKDFPTVTVLSMKLMSSTKIRYEMQLSGPSHMTLFIQPLNGAKLKDWTFPKAPLRSNPRPPYLINLSWGIKDSLEFWLELEKPSENWNSSTVELGLGGHWTHHKDLITPDFKKFLDSFPSYVDATPCPASFETRIY